MIMRNAWLNQLRHTRSGPRFVELDDENVESFYQNDRVNEDPHVVYLRKLEREQIRVVIADLPELYREIIVLRDLEGFSYQEIATMLECPAGTVMSRLGRARAKLRRALASWAEPYKTVVVLREIEGQSYQEIAAALEIPEGTVRNRLFRARQMLREKLAGVLEGRTGRTT